MISEKMTKELNSQINKEMFSSYLYLSMSAWFESINHDGFAKWMQMQAQEEYGHAMKIYGYMNDQGARIELGAIEKPQVEWKNPLEAFEAAFAHEQFITKSINDLVNIAIDEKDHATNIFLHWFVEEQVEEEAAADDIVQKLKMVGESKNGIFMLDRELGRRGQQ